MKINSKNWCEFHRVNFDCNDWCPQCQEKLVEGLTEKCLTLLVPALTEMSSMSVTIQSVTPSSLSTDTKMMKTLPVTLAANTETEKMKSRNSVPIAESEYIKTAHHLFRKTLKNGVSFGLLFRWGSLWVGGHYSYKEKRYCFNLIPCLTVWLTKPGGAIPYVA